MRKVSLRFQCVSKASQGSEQKLMKKPYAGRAASAAIRFSSSRKEGEWAEETFELEELRVGCAIDK